MTHFHVALKCGCAVGFDVPDADAQTMKRVAEEHDADMAVEVPCEHHGLQVGMVVEEVTDCQTCKKEAT